MPDATDRAVEQLDDALWSCIDAGMSPAAIVEHLGGHQGVQDALAAETSSPPAASPKTESEEPRHA